MTLTATRVFDEWRGKSLDDALLECRDLIEMGRQERMLLGMAGRDRVLQQFSLQAVTRCYETLYSEMLAGSSSSAT